MPDLSKEFADEPQNAAEVGPEHRSQFPTEPIDVHPDLTRERLVRRAKQAGVSASGSKAELRKRLGYPAGE